MSPSKRANVFCLNYVAILSMISQNRLLGWCFQPYCSTCVWCLCFSIFRKMKPILTPLFFFRNHLEPRIHQNVWNGVLYKQTQWSSCLPRNGVSQQTSQLHELASRSWIFFCWWFCSRILPCMGNSPWNPYFGELGICFNSVPINLNFTYANFQVIFVLLVTAVGNDFLDFCQESQTIFGGEVEGIFQRGWLVILGIRGCEIQLPKCIYLYIYT